MIRALRDDRGWGIVTAMMAMALMMSLGLAMLAAVDTQSRLSGGERVRESSFNLTEGALNAETFTVANKWPSSATAALPDCSWSGGAVTATGGPVTSCPAPANISQTFSNKDTTGRASWSTKVRDNGGNVACEDTANSNCSYVYNETALSTQPRWDQNGDNLMWIRTQGTVAGSKRTLVALVRIQNDPVTFPQAAIVAGQLSVQGGNKTFIHQNGANITLRCDPGTSSTCPSIQKPENVEGPGTVTTGYNDNAITPCAPVTDCHILSADELDQLRSRAAQDGTYFPAGTCPATDAQWSGAVVFVENADCQLNGNLTINSPSKPGLLVFAAGTLRFNGNADFYGLMYFWNGDNQSVPFDGLGNPTLHGAVFVDGNGLVNNTGTFDLTYDPQAVSNVTAYGATGIVPNSFREINVP